MKSLKIFLHVLYFFGLVAGVILLLSLGSFVIYVFGEGEPGAILEWIRVPVNFWITLVLFVVMLGMEFIGLNFDRMVLNTKLGRWLDEL